MDEKKVDVSVTVEQLRAAGTDISKQVPALFKLGEWYLRKAKRTSNGADFTKANALYNAALVRSRSGYFKVYRRIVETYREFLYPFAKDGDEISVDEIRNEIDSHKEWIARERRIFKERVDEIDSSCKPDDKTEREYEIHAEMMCGDRGVFHDIQDMYIRLVSMLVKECESRLGKPPCDYAIIALGSVARMEATPFSDLEFAILYSDPAIGDKINYFRVLTHFLHLKVINLGETILPALGIEQLNDFQSSDPNSNWFYDSVTPRGISFDGAMPWASKTPLGRKATDDKPALELIRTPKGMAELQLDEEIDVKEGYHLADITSRAVLLYGDQALLDEYNMGVAEKLNTKSSVKKGKSTKTVGFTRGIAQMMLDVERYDPFNSYLGEHCVVGGLFNVKKQFYRLISLLLSNLGLIFDIKSPSPWQVISELQTRGIISDSEKANMKVCLSIANEIRLKTYFANDGQKELLSPVPRFSTEQSAGPPIFRYFDEDILVRLLSTSYDICNRCLEFCLKYIKQDNIDVSLFQKPSLGVSKAWLLGVLYHRLQNPGKALEYMKSVPEDSPDYQAALITQGLIYCRYEEYEESVEYFEKARQLHDQNKCMSNLRLLKCINGQAVAHGQMGNYKMAINLFKEAIRKHSEIYGEGFEILIFTCLLNLGSVYHEVGNHDLAVETFKNVEEMIMKKGLTNVSDQNVIYLNLYMAASLSELDQHAQSLKYLERALQLSHKVFGEHTSSIQLAQTYRAAGNIYCLCKLDNEAEAILKRSLDIFLLEFGDQPHPGKVHVLMEVGKFFYKKHQTNLKAVKILESALEQARTLYPPGKPKIIIAVVLMHLGIALFYAKKLEESLPYFQEAKETMDRILALGPNHLHSHTSTILYNMGRNYHELRHVFEARQCYEDALNIMSKIYGENSILGATCSMGAVCLHRANAEYETGNRNLAKDYCTKAVNISRKISLTKNSCRGDVVFRLYRLSTFCEALGEQDEALKHLEQAGMIAKAAGFKECVVDILVSLINKYAEMGCMIKSMMYYVEAGEIAKSLPAHDPLSPSTLEMLKLMKI